MYITLTNQFFCVSSLPLPVDSALPKLNHLHPRKKHVILYAYCVVRSYASHDVIRVDDDDDDDNDDEGQ